MICLQEIKYLHCILAVVSCMFLSMDRVKHQRDFIILIKRKWSLVLIHFPLQWTLYQLPQKANSRKCESDVKQNFEISTTRGEYSQKIG